MKHKRPIRFEGNIAYVPLTRGYEAIIDAADVPLVEGWNWRAAPDGHTVYAVRSERRGSQIVTIRLHRVITNAADDKNIDHADGNGLDNRRANLRVATHAENNHNSRRSVRNTSGFKGVSWHKGSRRWHARIRLGGKPIHIGCFTEPETAHEAYCRAAAQLHGCFARTA